LSVNISFDNELAVASILLVDWAPPLVEHLGRYFDVRDGILRLNYAHLSAERTCDWTDGLWVSPAYRERVVSELEEVAREGAIALTLKLLGHGCTWVKDSSSILDQDAYLSAEQVFSTDVLQGDSPALREAVLAEIAPRAIWVSWLLDSHNRHRFLDDREIMAALVTSTSKGDCIHCLQLVRIPRSSGHPFHEHLTTDSTVIRPPIPRASGH